MYIRLSKLQKTSLFPLFFYTYSRVSPWLKARKSLIWWFSGSPDLVGPGKINKPLGIIFWCYITFHHLCSRLSRVWILLRKEGGGKECADREAVAAASVIRYSCFSAMQYTVNVMLGWSTGYWKTFWEERGTQE